MSRTTLKIDNNLPRFSNNLDSVLSDAYKEAAKDTFIRAKGNAPYDKGGLRGESNPVERKSPHHWRVWFRKEYARFQEFGGDSKRRVRHYSTPGTGPHFLKNAGDQEKNNLIRKIKKHGSRAKA